MGHFIFISLIFFDRTIKYISSSVKDIHGLEPAETTFQDILDQIHPDDMPFVAKPADTMIDMFYNILGVERYKKYKMSYCFRFMTTDGSYQLFNHQAILLTTDENGRGANSLNIYTNISHLTSENNYQVSAIDMFGEPSYLNIGMKDNLPLPKASDPPVFEKRDGNNKTDFGWFHQFKNC